MRRPLRVGRAGSQRRDEMIDCNTFIARYSDFRDGDLSWAESVEMEAHVDDCPACAHYDRVLRRGTDVFRALPELEVSDDFGDRLRWRLYQADDEMRRARSGAPAQAAGTLAIAAAVAAAGCREALAPTVGRLPAVAASAPSQATLFRRLTSGALHQGRPPASPRAWPRSGGRGERDAVPRRGLPAAGPARRAARVVHAARRRGAPAVRPLSRSRSAGLPQISYDSSSALSATASRGRCVFFTATRTSSARRLWRLSRVAARTWTTARADLHFDQRAAPTWTRRARLDARHPRYDGRAPRGGRPRRAGALAQGARRVVEAARRRPSRGWCWCSPAAIPLGSKARFYDELKKRPFSVEFNRWRRTTRRGC